MKSVVLAIFGVLFFTCALFAQTRQFPRTDLNAVPGSGESEIIFRLVNTHPNTGQFWYVISIDGRQVALVEPDIPEKVIVQNGYHRILVQSGVRGRNERITQIGSFSRELVLEANSTTTTVEITNSGQGRGVVRLVTEIAVSEQVSLGDTARTTSPALNTPGIEGALARAAEQTLRNIPQRSRIAIVYVTAHDRGTTDYIVGELEFIWVNRGFTLIDRSQLDRLRREQDFQMSGEVDDDTAVSIGRFAGADIIITGTVDGEGNLRRLRLRALNTQTAQVVGVASEAF